MKKAGKKVESMSFLCRRFHEKSKELKKGEHFKNMRVFKSVTFNEEIQ